MEHRTERALNKLQEASQSIPPPNTARQYTISIVSLFLIATVASVLDNERAVLYFTGAAGLTSGLMQLLKGQNETHLAVNSRMDKMIAATSELARLKGVQEGKEQQLETQRIIEETSTAKAVGGVETIQVEKIEAGAIEVVKPKK